MGSGREEEDKFLHMVVSSFLQKGIKYVSLARGGYEGMEKKLSRKAFRSKPINLGFQENIFPVFFVKPEIFFLIYEINKNSNFSAA